MFINKLEISNFRAFSEGNFEINNLNVPDNNNEGTGLTIFLGENGVGKTTILDSLALTLLEYKADQFSVDDINNIENDVIISAIADSDFKVSGTMPKVHFQSKGFEFTAGVRKQQNKTYLQSSIVCDQKFIRSDPNKPKDGSPDLRLSVNNPWAGKRFSENDILYLEKNRTFQTRSGTYNPTRFDRLMKDFNFQYLRKEDKQNMNPVLDDEYKMNNGEPFIQNEFLKEAISKFTEISGSRLSLEFVENHAPFDKAFFAERKDDRQIKLSDLGSGYEIIFSLIYSFYLSKQSGKQLILLIDEPELHLHPSLQKNLVSLLLEFSKDAQIILTTHSPLLLKELFQNSNVKFNVLRKADTGISLSNPEDRKLSYLSANEINYIAFDLETEEYHNELYEALKYNFDPDGGLKIKEFDNQFFIQKMGEDRNSPWHGHQNEVSVHTYIRNQIHHRGELGTPSLEDTKLSIMKMRSFFS